VTTDAKAGYCLACRDDRHSHCASATCACPTTGREVHKLRSRPKPRGVLIPVESWGDRLTPEQAS
jgi:hypothetical protein